MFGFVRTPSLNPPLFLKSFPIPNTLLFFKEFVKCQHIFDEHLTAKYFGKEKIAQNIRMYIFYSLMYGFFCLLFVAPPTEFVSAGLTIQNIFSGILGSEEMNFIHYHIRRSTVTIVVHSLLPLGMNKCTLFYINTS